MEFLSQIYAVEARIKEIESRFEEPTAPPVSFEKLYEAHLQPLPQSMHAGIGGKTGDFHQIIQEAGAQYGVDPSLVEAVIHQESGGNSGARSPVGALGLMQLMPETARSLGVSDPLDPRQNVFGGTRYLRGLLDQFNGNVSMALAAYNAGPNAVRRYGGIPPYRETQNYVKSILSLYESKRKSPEPARL